MKTFLLVLASLIACVPAQVSIAQDTVSFENGDVIDTFNGINIHYNGLFSGVSGRNVSSDGYNIGLKYQCVEFVKRYYLYTYDHKMPNPWGHARDFYNSDLADGEFNSERGLYQHNNGGSKTPEVGDIMVFSPSVFNSYGHVAIVSKVLNGSIEVVQQNTPLAGTRETIAIDNTNVLNSRIMGWLSINL